VSSFEGFSFESLTPTAFLARSATVHRERVGVVDGALESTYGELWERALRFAGMLGELGVRRGERVAVLADNSHLMLEAHYGVPLAGAVLVALNMRLSAAELGYILDHSGANLLLCGGELGPGRRAPRRPEAPRWWAKRRTTLSFGRPPRPVTRSQTSASSSQSTTPAGRRGDPRGSCTTTAARICRRINTIVLALADEPLVKLFSGQSVSGVAGITDQLRLVAERLIPAV
jgi:acyl-CoA synthetase (AMP-forming)/AMP-acid ligase II